MKEGMNFKGTEETDPREFGNDQMEVAKERKEPMTTRKLCLKGGYIQHSLQAVQYSEEECWTCGSDHQCSISRSNTKVCTVFPPK